MHERKRVIFPSEQGGAKHLNSIIAYSILVFIKMESAIIELLKEIRDGASKIQQACEQLIGIFSQQAPTPPAPSPPEPSTPAPAPAPLSTLDEFKKRVGEELLGLLEIQEEEDAYKIVPKRFLGSENFIKVATAARAVGGDYISAGKDSHFKIPKK